ncbi:nSTAND1 domain-containing NTPase [Mastigocladopsis repens]|uniref:nSTAND1 domain-containing NTPase n=1 Tax=Mastigocladopsis repens TaxID=221287 RepID=UPI0002D8403C|nr:CHAT domain-containing protein [Mastigocladopsis repens]
MDKIVVLNFVVGDFQQGFAVTLQIGQEGAFLSAGISGALPQCPELPQFYKKWQQAHRHELSRAIKPKSGITNASINTEQAVGAAEALRNQLNTWLNQSQEFRLIRERLKEILHRDDTIRVLLQAQNPELLQLPWHLWDFFERYPKAELALSHPTFEAPATVQNIAEREKVRILAIFGNSTGIDINTDRKLLQKNLPNTEIVFLVEPSRQELNDQLWDNTGWSILFFAGHGETEGDTGKIHINPSESLTIPELNYAVTAAIQRGLRLTIFNCCDGLGLARQLASLQLPQVIVMREPVADQVAQDFLKHFLRGFASGKPLYLAVRQARERLEWLENQFPYASWLPVICQNPAELPPRWIDLGGTPRCPYKGLSGFREEDNSVFFGREAFTQRLLEAVKNKPMVGVIGPSGRGKSSVVFAGLIPHLLEEKDKWQIAHFRPGKRPFDSLAAALLSVQSTQASAGNEGEPQPTQDERPLGGSQMEHRLLQIHQLATQLRSSKDALTQFIARISSANPKSILLVADQFEELYTLCPDFEERESFLDCLLGGVYDAPCFKLVLTLRSDFYGYAQSYRAFNDALQDNCLNLGPMNQQELREAIAHPAYSYGVTLEAGLIERILNDVGQKIHREAQNSQQKSPPDKLPLLEFTLKQLWTEAIKNRTRQLTNQAYNEIGGIEEALGKYAEEVYDQIVQEYHPKQIRRVFTQLVRPGETTGTEDTRRLATRQEIGEENWELVTRLNSEDMRLVVIGYDEATTEETVEVVHEALILGWGRLKEWMKSDRTFRTWQERLRGGLRQWEISSNDEGALLRGASLAEAEAWLHLRLEEISPPERVFIELSLELRDRLLREEEERRQRDLQQERKARQAAQRMTSVAIASTILVSGAAIFAFNQWHEIDKQYANAEILAASTSASGLLQLDGLIESLKVGKKLRQQKSGIVEPKTRMQVVSGLLQVFYGVKEQNRLSGHGAPVTSVSISSDGQTIASASADKTVKLWKRDGSLITTLKAHSEPVTSVGISSDGQTIASASADKTVKLWKPDGSLITTLTGHNDRVMGVSISSDGQTIASGSRDKTVKLWKRDGGLLTTLKGHSEPVTSVGISSDGQTIASASADKTVKLWKRDGSLLTTLKGHSEPIMSVSISPDGQTIASASFDKTVKLWKRDGSLLTTLKGHSDPVTSVSISPDGQTIASASADITVKLWRRDGSLISTLTGHTLPVMSVSISPDGQTIASASWDKTVKLWKRNGSLITTLTKHNERVTDVSISPDGQIIASASWDKTVKLWKDDGSLITTLIGHSGWVMGVSISPDGQTIASASTDKTVKLWKRDGSLITTLIRHSAPVISVSISPDGQTIASASADKTVKLWKRDGSLITTLVGHSDQVSGVSISPDEQTIASASWDKTVKLWKRDGSLITTLVGHSDRVIDVSISSDGQTIASASADKTVKLWKRNGSLITTLIGHSDRVTDASISPDGQTIASASADNTVKLWKHDGSLITTLNGHSSSVYGISFTPDGQTIASAGGDRTVILWNLNLDDLLRRGCSWAQDYLKNPNNGMSNDDSRRVCVDIKPLAITKLGH